MPAAVSMARSARPFCSASATPPATAAMLSAAMVLGSGSSAAAQANGGMSATPSEKGSHESALRFTPRS